VQPPWQFADVGAVGTPGNAQGSQTTIAVSGAGGDIWGAADSFSFVYQPLRDGRVDTRVSSESNTSPFAKAGVMIRQTLDPGAPMVILDVKPDGGLEFMTRSTQGGETTFLAGGSVAVSTNADGRIEIGATLHLSRLGDTVVGSYCLGTQPFPCFQIGTTSFPTGPAVAGLAVTSHDPTTRNQAVFDGPVVTSLPSPWISLETGPVNTTGFATYEEATGSFFVSGEGGDMWCTFAAFHTVAQAMGPNSLLPTNSQLTTRVVSEQNTNAFAKAGLVFEALGSTSARVILDVKPDGGVEFMARSADGASMAFVAGSTASFPVWLRLTRTGNDFTGDVSQDGQVWTNVGSVTVALPSSVLGGFAVTSHAQGALNAAVFDNVGVTTGLGLGRVGPNLVSNPGFEDSIPPATGPGWVADTPLRQTAAVTETELPHSGTKNAACHTTSGDCGIYQDITATGLQSDMVFAIYARADHPGALVGVNVDGTFAGSMRVAPGGYQRYVMGLFVGAFTSNPNPVIRVWMYAPPGGVVAIDDVQLVVFFDE